MLQMKKYSTFWELSSFVVNPKVQGKGYGKQMLKATLEHVDMPVCLRVQQDNPAQFLYTTMGFQSESLFNGRYSMRHSLV